MLLLNKQLKKNPYCCNRFTDIEAALSKSVQTPSRNTLSEIHSLTIKFSAPAVTW